MTREDALKQLLQGVKADYVDCLRLEQLLEGQFKAALRHETASLSVIGADITVVVDAMEGRRIKRVELTSALLKSRRPASMAALIDTLSGKPRDVFAALWMQLEAKLAECKALNVRNGQLMASQFEIMQRVLHGESDIYAPG